MNMVKIIIIGIIFEKRTVCCNRQFFSMGPIPYYRNDGYFVPDYAPPYHEPLPLYYPNENIHPPQLAFRELYPPPQLFHQDRNYHAPQAPPGPISQAPQILQYQINPPPPSFVPPHPLNMKPTDNTVKTPQPVKIEVKPRPSTFPKLQIKFHSNIIQKHDNYPPYYHDEYNKDYHEEDYPDYSEDSSPQSEPCKLDSPYRYFQAVKINPNNPFITQPGSPCNPFFQPNAAYGLKTPITLLPSRFPPRVEQFIERIQNYFSTYTQQGQQNAQNQTALSTSLPPVTVPSVSSESIEPTMWQTPDSVKKNTTEETPVTFTMNLEPLEVTTVATFTSLEQVTEKPEILTIQSEELGKVISSTEPTFVEDKKDVQMEVQNTIMPNEVTTDVPMTTEGINSNENETTSAPIPLEVNHQQIFSTQIPMRYKNFTEEQFMNTSEAPTINPSVNSLLYETQTKGIGTDVFSSTESAQKENNTEYYNNISTTNEIFHGVNDKNS